MAEQFRLPTVMRELLLQSRATILTVRALNSLTVNHVVVTLYRTRDLDTISATAGEQTGASSGLLIRPWLVRLSSYETHTTKSIMSPPWSPSVVKQAFQAVGSSIA